MREQPTHAAHRFPVSVKGVVVRDERVLLLRNERGEWEPPGGELELGEDPAECVVREVAKESGWRVSAGPLLDAWQYHVRLGRDVLIVTYGCHASPDEPAVGDEHRQIGLFTEDAVAGLPMPQGYKRSIATWYEHLRISPPPSPTGTGSPPL